MIRHAAGRKGQRFRSILRFCSIATLTLAATLIAQAAFADGVRGRVLDPLDRPVKDAEVLLTLAKSSRIAATARTDAEGRFGPITVVPGDYVVLVVTPGLRSTRPTVTVKEGGTAEIELKLAVSAISESVVVSAAQVDTTLSRATDSVTVETAADLAARQSENVSDAVRFVPGFGVVASGGRGAITSFFPRGGESDYTLVLVDGIPQNAFGGGFDAAHLAVANVDRVEVVRGPQSALYGGGAIGGIVHVLTRNGGPTRAGGLFEGGGYGTLNTTVHAAGSLNNWTWGGAIERERTDGDTRTFPAGQISNDDYERTSGSGSFGWSNGTDRRFRVDVRGGQNERGFPGPYGEDPLGRYFGVDTESRGTNTDLSFGVSGAIGQTAGIRHAGQFTSGDFKSHFESSFGPSDNRSRRTAGRYQIDLERARGAITGGVEILRERADNTFITGSTFEEIPIERAISGIFLEVRPQLGDRVFVTGGVRFEHITRRALDGDGFSRPTFEDDVVNSTNPKIAVAWFVRPADSRGWTKIRGGAGTGIKTPTVFEIGFTDNPALKPEHSRSFDIGVEQALAGSTVVADLTWFDNRYDDLIVSTGTALTGASRFRTDNVANASSRGLEFGVTTRPFTGLMLRGSWTYLDTEVLDVDGLPGQAPPPFSVGDPLIRRPRQQGSLEVRWANPRLNMFLTVNGRGEMLDLEPNFATPAITSKGYTAVGAGGAFTIVKGLEVTARVSNLFNRAYEEALGFPALGRAAMVGLRVTPRH